MTDKKFKEILFEMYRRSFAASTPKGDWDELLANAEVNEEGQKIIPFNDYECEIEVMEDIVNDVLTEYNVRGTDIAIFKYNFYLGCSPKTKVIK